MAPLVGPCLFGRSWLRFLFGCFNFCVSLWRSPTRPDGADLERLLVVALRTPDDRQSCVFGHVVPCKGIDTNKFAVDSLVSDILWTDYTHFT